MNKILQFNPLGMALAAILFVAGTTHAQRVYLVVDRDTGELSAVSSESVEIDGYSIFSSDELLDPEAWNSLADQGAPGWVEATPRPAQLNELNPSGASELAAGQAVSLGSAYNGAGVAPSDESLSFQFASSGVVQDGSVFFTGTPQIPHLSVDRQSGAVEVRNPAGFEIAGYSIISDSGSLNPANLTGLSGQGVNGWSAANPKDTRISELSFDQNQTVNGASPITVGNVFAGGSEDLVFEYLEGDTLVNGSVIYTGAVNDLTLRVDVLSGSAEILNPAGNPDSFDILGYNIFSDSGGLSADGWTSIADAGEAGWAEANGREDALAELNPSSTKTFGPGSSFALGNIFAGSDSDLRFEYAVGNELFEGTVDYVLGGGGPPSCADIAASRLAGDFNDDGAVGVRDFLVLSRNFNSTGAAYDDGDANCDEAVNVRDFLILSRNFGASAGATAAAVPEPSTGMLAFAGLMLGLMAGRRKR